MADLRTLSLASAAMLALAGCDWMKKQDPPGAKSESEIAREREERLRRACASSATYDRLKELAFDQAARIRNQDPRALDALAAASVVRMEQPVLKSRDEELNVTVCRGRFVLELPPGAENAFDGERRLTADVEYAAQAALDGSGLVYQMDGAEPLIYRLATAGGLPRQTASVSASAPVTLPLPSGVPAAPRVPAGQSPPVATTSPPVAPAAPAPRAQPQPQFKASPAPAPAPASAGKASSPSFNCNRARSRSERMVCSSNALAAKDRQMSSLFYSALADADGGTRQVLRSSRDRFLAYRERCGSEACVAEAYDGRMAEIRDIMADAR